MDAVEQRDVELVRVKVGRTTRTAAAGRRLLVVATLGLSQVGHLKQCLHHSLRVGCLCDHLVQAQLEQAEVEIELLARDAVTEHSVSELLNVGIVAQQDKVDFNVAA